MRSGRKRYLKSHMNLLAEMERRRIDPAGVLPKIEYYHTCKCGASWLAKQQDSFCRSCNGAQITFVERPIISSDVSNPQS